MTRHLITSALPYINGIKHLGNLVGSMLPADVYARFLRRRGHDVLYICATDEHGAPAELAALAAGMGVAEYCAKQHEVQADIYARFDLSFDYFGRSSNRSNHDITQQIFTQLDASGYISERSLALTYSPADGRFLPDRYVIGTCPRCGYQSARGDQCENCTSVLDPTDLIDPRSAVSGSTELEVRESKHLFLCLSALQERVGEWVEAQEHWPLVTRQVARKWLAEGLRDRCITRDLAWGIPVPKPGYEDKVFYVWFDAPIAYIAATRDWAEARGEPDAWKPWWSPTEDVTYTQFMGKDNLPFHTVMFPASLIGTNHPWKLVDQIKGFHWMNYYGGKFSTSEGRGVFTDQALALYPADYWRWFLIVNAPETADFPFTWEQFAAVVNKDLAGILGNFVNRVLKLTQSKFGDTIPAGGTPGEAEAALSTACRAEVERYLAAMERIELREAMRAVRTLWTLGNGYIDERAPWALVKTDRDAAALVLRTCFQLIWLFAVASAPIMPRTSARLCDALQLSDDERAADVLALTRLDALAAGRPFTVIPPAFDKIAPEDIERHKQQFGC